MIPGLSPGVCNMNLNIDNAAIRRLIPGIIHEVEGETSLYEKILPWIESARTWMEQNILGTYEPEAGLLQLTEKIIVNKAFADAVPSLDLTLSPAGFAVISTEGRAPASKERIERLIASLNSAVDSNLTVLSCELPGQEQWRLTVPGQWFLATFIPDFAVVPYFRSEKDLMSTYRSMRDIALRFEQELAERFLGRQFLRTMRLQHPLYELPGTRDIYGLIRNTELRYISAHLRDQKIRCPDQHEVWHLARPIISELNYWPQLKEMWEKEMASTVKVEPFNGNRKGGMWL